MKKPSIEKTERFDYKKCEEYIQYKLGYNLRDTLGKFEKDENEYDKIEYRDFWHFIVDHCVIHNGCEFEMPEPDDEYEPWQNEILEVFIDEFGYGPYWVCW